MKKQLYQIKTIPSKFDRERYIQSYKKLIALNQKIAEVINQCKKYGFNENDVIIKYSIKMIKEYKLQLADCFDYGYKIVTRKDIKYDCTITLIPHSSDLRMALDSIKYHLKNKRKEQKFFYNESFIHQMSGYWLNKQLKRIYSSLDENKKPRTEDRYLGIEIECIIPIDSDIKKLMLPLAKYVSLAHDGSIDASEFNYNSHSSNDCEDPDNCGDSHKENYEGREIRVLVKESELNEILPKVCTVLDDIGAKVNKSCGLHVHFDMRGTNHADRGTIYAKLYHALPLLTQIVPETRRKNTYCKRNMRSKPNYNGNRYRMINVASYYKHNTFEIRLFNSSTNAQKIINWINLLQGIMKSEIYLRCPSSFKKAKTLWGMSNELVAWAEARQKKFKASIQDTNEPLPSNIVMNGGSIIDYRSYRPLEVSNA